MTTLTKAISGLKRSVGRRGESSGPILGLRKKVVIKKEPGVKEEPKPPEPKKRQRRAPLRKRRRHNKLRYEGVLPDSEIPLEHLLDHSVADPRCSGCEAARASSAPATAVPAELKVTATRPRERVHVDLVSPEEEDINGNVALMLSLCDATDYPRALTMRDKEAATALTTYRTLYPGSVRSGTFPETTISDNGPEFRSEFKEGIAAAGGGHVSGPAR